MTNQDYKKVDGVNGKSASSPLELVIKRQRRAILEHC